MKSYHSLAWKELWTQKVTSVLILIAIILSTMMTTVIGQSIGILSAMREQQAASLNGNRYATFHQLTEDQAEAISTDDRVSFAGSCITLGTTEIESSGLSLLLREYEGDALSAYPSLTQLDSGRLPTQADEIALPQDVLDLMGYSGKLGDTVMLTLHISLMHDNEEPYEYTSEFTLTGILKSNYIGYVSGSVSGVVGSGSAKTLLPEKYQLMSTDIRLHDKSRFQQIVNDFGNSFEIPDYCIQYNDILLSALEIDYDGKDESDASGFPFMAAAGVLVGALVLMAAGLVIYNILKISVTKHISEYGTLRALGAESVKLYILVAMQLAILCCMGIPFGVVLGVLSAKGITIAATSVLSPEIFLANSHEELAALILQNSTGKLLPLVVSTAITLVFAFIAVMPAAHYAAKVSPTLAMSGTTVHVKRRNRNTGHIRCFEAFYAKMNMKRNTGRTVITILSLVMSITVFIALQSFSGLLDTASSVQKMHLGDYSITSETVGFAPEVVEELKEQPGVSSVSTLKYSLYTQDKDGNLPINTSITLQPSEALHIVGVDEERLKTLAPTLTNQQIQDLKSGNACLIKNPIVMAYGEDAMEATSISTGDVVSVSAVELGVIGVCNGAVTLDNDGFVNGVQVIVFDTVYDRLTGKNTYSELYPVLTADTDRDIAETVIDQICTQAGGHWLSYQNTDKQLEESYQQIKLLAWGLILFIGLIGLLNIINTTYTNIHTRVNEIGIQRAIGMSIASLYKTFLWEGAYYGIIAGIIGAVAGYICTIFVGAAATDQIELVALPIIAILQATVVSIAACLIATCLPLRQIARMSIVDSIETVE